MAAIPKAVNDRIEAKLSARQVFFSLVDDIRTRQRNIYQEGKATQIQRNELRAMLERLDRILDKAAQAMLKEGIIVPAPPSQFNGGSTCSYVEKPVRIDYVARDGIQIPKLMDFTFRVLMMRKWQLITRASRNSNKCLNNLFGWQRDVDDILKRGWLWDQLQATQEYLRIWREHEKNKQQHSQTN